MIGLLAAFGLATMNDQTVDAAAKLRQNMAVVPQSAKLPINRFGVDTLAKLSATADGKNVMISPWSLQECFGMLRLGAEGRTEKELKDFLKQAESPMNSAVGLQQLRNAVKPMETSGQLRQANGLWIRKGFEVKPQFVTDVMSFFGAKAKQATFPSPALDEVNGFVSEQTRGKIPKLFDQFDRDTSMVLVNAISFLDKWASPFKRENTKNLPFWTSSGGQKSVPTMTGQGEYRYAKGEHCQALTLPYKSGLGMTIVLPDKGTSVASVLGQSDLLNNLNSISREDRGSVFIPRWQSEFSWNLRKWMEGQGVKAAFDPASADFSGISNVRLVVSQAVQKTYIKVDEEGTEAAAATGITMRPTSIRVGEPFEFRADHPFAYFIWSPGGVVLFAGIVNNPAG
ncbi:MAG: serpin family protein [Armatimonadetes bacterium]|nr:serpin family protein [Armatimonadota bacterium]